MSEPCTYSITVKSANTEKAGKVRLYLRVYQRDGSPAQRYFNTKIDVFVQDWDFYKNKLKTTCSSYKELNKLLQDFESRYKNFEYSYINQAKPFNLKMFDLMKESKQGSFLAWVDRYIDSRSDYAPNTTKIHKTTRGILYKINPELSFEDVNPDLLKQIRNQMIEEGLKTNYISTTFKRLKTWLKAAEKEGLIKHENNPSHDFRVRTEKTQRPFLDWERVQQLESFIPANETLQIIKDLFLFSCYTGLRLSDVQSLSKDSIQKAGEGFILNLTMQKTKDPIRLPLFLLFPSEPGQPTKPESILIKYLDQEQTIPGNVFPFLTDQYINRQLKAIAEILHWNIDLTFHISRHTFISYLAVRLPLPVVKELAGHEDIKTTMQYIHITGKDVDEGLKRVRW